MSRSTAASLAKALAGHQRLQKLAAERGAGDPRLEPERGWPGTALSSLPEGGEEAAALADAAGCSRLQQLYLSRAGGYWSDGGACTIAADVDDALQVSRSHAAYNTCARAALALAPGGCSIVCVASEHACANDMRKGLHV